MRIAIVGYGLEGESAYKFLQTRYPDAEFAIYDQSQQPKIAPPEAGNVSLHLGEIDFATIEAGLIIRTPAVAPSRFRDDMQTNLSSVTQLFFDNCPCPIIGVTGSKGKGTTASLIEAMLKRAGRDVHLLGNIGVPALDLLDQLTADSIVIYELSSFQLWNLTKSPQVAVVVHIEPDHLDVHADLADYLAAKANIAKHQTAGDTIIYLTANSEVAAIAEISPAQHKIAYPDAKSAHVSGDDFYYNDQKICSINNLHLVGQHNLDNTCAAIDAAWQFSQDVEALAAGIADFEGLDHRLKLVGETTTGVRFFDDSIATTIGSVKAAIKAVQGPKILIMGGSSKGANFADLQADLVANSVRHIVAIGDEAGRIADSLSDIKSIQLHRLGKTKTMAEIVDFAYALAEPNWSIILSPACASFDMFTDYADRGNQFKARVFQILKATK